MSAEFQNPYSDVKRVLALVDKHDGDTVAVVMQAWNEGASRSRIVSDAQREAMVTATHNFLGEECAGDGGVRAFVNDICAIIEGNGSREATK